MRVTICEHSPAAASADFQPRWLRSPQTITADTSVTADTTVAADTSRIGDQGVIPLSYWLGVSASRSRSTSAIKAA